LKSRKEGKEYKAYPPSLYYNIMPRRCLHCDYCDKLVPKDELPAHIRSKHWTDLRHYLIQEAIESKESVIHSFMEGNACVPIPSKTDGVRYWYGIKPIAMEKKDIDKEKDYIDLSANREAHIAFVTRIMESISLIDYLRIMREKIEEPRRAENKEPKDSPVLPGRSPSSKP